jgi:hypothetical protein
MDSSITENERRAFRDQIVKYARELDLHNRYKQYLIEITQSTGASMESPNAKAFMAIFTEELFVDVLTESLKNYFSLEEITKLVAWETSELGKKFVNLTGKIYMEVDSRIAQLIVFAATPAENSLSN